MPLGFGSCTGECSFGGAGLGGGSGGGGAVAAAVWVSFGFGCFGPGAGGAAVGAAPFVLGLTSPISSEASLPCGGGFVSGGSSVDGGGGGGGSTITNCTGMTAGPSFAAVGQVTSSRNGSRWTRNATSGESGRTPLRTRRGTSQV